MAAWHGEWVQMVNLGSAARRQSRNVPLSPTAICAPLINLLYTFHYCAYFDLFL